MILKVLLKNNDYLTRWVNQTLNCSGLTKSLVYVLNKLSTTYPLGTSNIELFWVYKIPGLCAEKNDYNLPRWVRKTLNCSGLTKSPIYMLIVVLLANTRAHAKNGAFKYVKTFYYIVERSV